MGQAIPGSPGLMSSQRHSLPEEAETATVTTETVGRTVPTPICRAAVQRINVKRTAAQHSVLTRIRPLRINHIFLWIITIPVLAPLLHIAVHIVKAPGVRGETACRCGFPSKLALLAVAIDGRAQVIGLVLPFSSFGLPITKLPGGIQTNFMPLPFVKFLGGSFGWARIGEKHARTTTRLRQK